MRATLLRRERVSPYALGGFGVGVSRPNVNEMFSNPVTNQTRVFGVEGNEGIVAFAPLRAGLAWRF